MRTDLVGTILELVGLALVVLAGFLIWLPLGVALAGAAVFLVGASVEGGD